MTVMVTEIYDAFREAKVSDETARKAAEAVAAYERDMAGLRTDMKVLKGLGATLVTLVILVLGGQVALWTKVAEIAARLGH